MHLVTNTELTIFSFRPPFQCLPIQVQNAVLTSLVQFQSGRITTGVQPHAGFTIHPSSQSSIHNQNTQLQNPRSAGRLQRLVSQRAPDCQLISQSATSLCHARTPFRRKSPTPADFSPRPGPTAIQPPLDTSALCALLSLLSARHKPQAHSARPLAFSFNSPPIRA